MLPYLIAGAIGFAVAKLFEEDETPKYDDGGYIKNIKKLYEEDGSDVYGGDFGEAGGLNWRINKEQDYLYLMGIGRNKKTGSNEGESKGEGSRAIAYLFNLYPKVDVIYFEIDGEEGAWQFYKKIGAEEEGGGEIVEHTYNAQITRESIKKYFKNKDISFSFNYGGSVLLAPNGKPSNLTPEQYKLVRTKAFKQWFGDWENEPANASKVVDENGEPKVMYRGNPKEQGDLGYTFNQGYNFLNKKKKNNFGFFFTDDIDVAKKYMKVSMWGEIQGGSITEVFLNVKNVFDITPLDYFSEGDTFSNYLTSNNLNFLGYEKLIKRINDYKYYEHKEQPNIYGFFDRFPRLRNFFIFNKIDGIVFLEKSRTYLPYLTYVVWESNQIKLADGTNTTFDGSNPDIRFDDGGIIISNEYSTDSYDFGNVGNAIIQNGIEVGQIQYDINTNNSISIYLLETLQKGIGAKVINYFFANGVNIIYGDAVDSFDFWKKMGAKFDEFNEDINGYPFTISKEDFMQTKYFKNPDIRFDGGGMSYREYADTQFNEEEDRYLPSDYFDDLEIKKLSKDNLPLIKIKDGLEYRKWGDSFIKVFDNDYRVGFADTKAIQVAKEYQKKGIGLELVTLLKEMNPNHRFGSMTPQGFNLMGKYYDTKIANNPDIRFDDGGLTYSDKIEFINQRVLINGKDVGLLEFTIRKNELEIDRLYLRKENQKNGIGRKIISELFNKNPNVNKIIVYPLGNSIPFWLRFTEKVTNDDYYEITKESLSKGLENYPLKKK